MYLHDRYDRKLCCLSNDEYNIKKSIPENLSEYWSSDYYLSARKKMLNDEYVENCTHCYRQTAAGEFSERDRYTMMFKDRNIKVDLIQGNQWGTPLDIELRPGNLCNLKCRMCEPNASSQLDKEFRNNKSILDSPYLSYTASETDAYIDINSDNIEYLLQHADHINQIKLLGGEPTIMPETIEILRTLIEKNILDMYLHITTNCTNTNEQFLELIQHFNNVCYNFSIDGVGKTLEYIRYPLRFSKVTGNIIALCRNLLQGSSAVLYTLQAYSLKNTIDFLNWIVELHHILRESNETEVDLQLIVSDLKGPSWASIQCLPIDVRNKWIDEIFDSNVLDDFSNDFDEVVKSDFLIVQSNITEVLRRLRTDTTQYSMESLVDVTKRFDVVRRQHIKDYIPEIWEIMDQDFYNDLDISKQSI
jgi:hypothetical protein